MATDQQDGRGQPTDQARRLATHILLINSGEDHHAGYCEICDEAEELATGPSPMVSTKPSRQESSR